MERTYYSLLLFYGIVTVYCQWDTSNCKVVDTVLLNNGETKVIARSGSPDDRAVVKDLVQTVSHCWRIVPSGEGRTHVIQIEVDETREEEVDSPQLTCESEMQVMNGLYFDQNATIIDRCDDWSETRTHREVFYSTEPSVFIRWSYLDISDVTFAVSGSISVSLQPISDSVADCARFDWSSQESVMLTSDNYPNNYNSDTYQCWLFTKTGDTSLFSLYIEDVKLNVPFKDYCYDKLEIYAWDNNDNSKIKLLHRICSVDYEQRYIYISHKQILFRFTSDSDNENDGFKITVTNIPSAVPFTSECAPIKMHPSSQPVPVTSPNYPDQYSNDADLCWSVSLMDAEREFRVTVQFPDGVELDPWWAMDCVSYSENTFIQDRLDIITDGTKEVTSLCGTRTHVPDLWYNETFYIRMRTDGHVTATGFRIVLLTERTDCISMFLHPGYQATPLNKDRKTNTKDVEMSWHLSTIAEWTYDNFYSFFSSTFVLILDIYEVGLNPDGDCLTDYLKIYNGSSSTAPLIKTFCPGDVTTSQKVWSSTRNVFITYKVSVESVYNITVRAVHEGFTHGLQSPYQTDIYCSQGFFSRNDSAWRRDIYMLSFSRRFNLGYSVDCEIFTLRDAMPQDRLQLNISWADTSFGPPADDCDERFIAVIAGDSSDGPVMWYICDEKVNLLTYPGPSITLVNVAQGAERLQGVINVVKENRYGRHCIEIPINTTEDYYISSPNYPLLYPSNQDICWIAYQVTPNPNLRLVFRLGSFHTNRYSRSPCNDKDRFSIMEGNATDDERMLVVTGFCAQDTESIHVSYKKWCRDREFLKVRFTSHEGNATYGFYGYFSVAAKENVCDPYGYRGPTYPPPTYDDDHDGIGGLVIFGIIFGCVAGIVIVACVCYFGRKKCKSDNDQSRPEQQGLPPMSEQQQMEQVSRPPNYQEVVQNNAQYPVTSGSSASNAQNNAASNNVTSGASGNNEAAPPAYRHYRRDDNTGVVNPSYSVSLTDPVRMSTLL